MRKGSWIVASVVLFVPFALLWVTMTLGVAPLLFATLGIGLCGGIAALSAWAFVRAVG